MEVQEEKQGDYFSVSFRMMGDDLDPLEITSFLGIEPDIAHKKGEPRIGKSKKGKIIQYAPFDSGMWSIESKPLKDDDATLQEHIENILDRIEPKRDLLL
jgi:hypothetical protein